MTASTTGSSGGGASKKGGFDDLDDDLDLLLGDNSDKETKRGGRQKNKVNAKSSTAKYVTVTDRQNASTHNFNMYRHIYVHYCMYRVLSHNLAP